MNETKLDESLQRLTATDRDLALRILSLKRALVKKGLLTVEDFDTAEKETAEVEAS